jgi:hypothetical protein
MAAALRDRGVDAAVLMPGPLLKIGALPTAEYAAALAAAYDDWILATWLGREPNLHAALLVPPHDPAAAAKLIEQHAGRGFCAVVAPLNGIEPMLGDRRYDPLYAAVEAADLPLVLHTGGGQPLLPVSPHLITQHQNGFEQIAMSAPLIASGNLVSMVGTGVFARYPALRVAFLGGGLSWLTHMLLRMDKEYNENRRDVPYFTDRVSLYLRRQVWLGTGSLERGLGAKGLTTLLRISLGADHALYASGWPLPDADPPPDDLGNGVLGDVARDLFRLGTS